MKITKPSMKNADTTKKVKKSKGRANKPAAAAPAPKKETASKDAFGGRIGSRSNKINEVLIGGFIGSAAKIAEKAKEPVANVSAQLSWLHGKGLVARKKENGETGDFIYKMSSKAAGHNGKPDKQNRAAKHAPAEVDGATEEEETTTE